MNWKGIGLHKTLHLKPVIFFVLTKQRSLKGKLIGDICGDELFLKRTLTSDRLLADSELRYPYEGSKTLMHVFDSFDDKALIQELLEGMYAELPEKKPKKG